MCRLPQAGYRSSAAIPLLLLVPAGGSCLPWFSQNGILLENVDEGLTLRALLDPFNMCQIFTCYSILCPRVLDSYSNAKCKNGTIKFNPLHRKISFTNELQKKNMTLSYGLDKCWSNYGPIRVMGYIFRLLKILPFSTQKCTWPSTGTSDCQKLFKS